MRKDNNRINFRYLTDKDINIIKDLYTIDNLSTVKIGEQFGVNRKTIARVLDSLGIERTNKCKRKFIVNEHYFDEINTPNKAYILGFFYADGSNCKSKGTITMSLQEEDKDILEQIRLELNSEKPLIYLDYSKKHDGGYHYKNQYRLSIYSAHLCKSLEDKGMIPDKSLSLVFPEWLDKKFYSHFIRGYFDGDGSFHNPYLNGKKRQPLITFTSTLQFCERLRQVLIQELNIPGGGIYDASCHNNVTKVYSICGMNQTKTVLDWLYADAEMYLTRKYNVYNKSFYQ